jgi:CHASE2 domain
LLWIAILMVIGHFLEVSGVLKGFETAGLDTFLRLNSRKMSDRVVLVEITDEDYDNPALFDGQSPLKSAQLIALISSLQQYQPAVIAMDFDTESGDWCQLPDAALQKILPAPENSQDAAPHPPVVWAEVPANLDEPLELTRVLAGKLQNLAYVGVPRFPVDSDGLVRRYEEKFLVQGALGDCSQKTHEPRDIPAGTQHLTAVANRDRLPSFANAIHHFACESRKVVCPPEPPDSDQPVIFNFYGDRYRFPIIQSHEFIGPEARTVAPQ